MNPITVYLYELRRGEEIIATGHITYEQPVEIGERITVAGREGIIREIEAAIASSPSKCALRRACSSLAEGIQESWRWGQLGPMTPSRAVRRPR